MLHDPSHVHSLPVVEEIRFSPEERDILRRFGQEIFDISQDPVNDERVALWTKLNDLRAERPMVWMNELPWHEMDYDGELELKTTGAFARDLETRLRRVIYQWKHLPGDMVVSPYIVCEKVFHSTDFGIVEQVDTAHTDEKNEIYSRRFHAQIKDEADIEKIKMPVISYLKDATEFAFSAMTELFRDVIDVRLEGQTHIWFTPWDYLIRWWGVEEAMLDLYERPEMVCRAYERMVDAWCVELDQFVELNLLSLDCNNTRIGSGGYGYVSALPGANFDPGHVKPHNMWGCSNAQIFSCVSPEMHWEFALRHDMRWLSRFGLNYYGCCEQLHNKIGILRHIPNLRKISVSGWADVERSVSEIGRDYVLSRKPNPAVFAGDVYDEAAAKAEILEFQEKSDGLNVEYIMKDVSTVNYKPQRLWEWEKMIMSIVRKG
jgi:hypothetical protein